jgi:hypothetical protein
MTPSMGHTEIDRIALFQKEHLTLNKRWCADSESGPGLLR